VLDTYVYIDEELEKTQLSKINNSAFDSIDDNQDGLLENGAVINSYKTAQESVIELVRGNLYEWLNYDSMIYGESFNVKKSIFNILKKDVEDIPIDLVDGQFVYIKSTDKTVESDEIKNTNETSEIEKQKSNVEQIDQTLETDAIKIWLEKNEFNISNSANQTVIELLLKENKYFRSLAKVTLAHKSNWATINQTLISQKEVRFEKLGLVYPLKLHLINRKVDIIRRYYGQYILPGESDWVRTPVPYRVNIIYYIIKPVLKLLSYLRKCIAL
jgi:hypothetical protein